jgi:hypothetical protein
LVMLITSIFRHSTNVSYHENKIVYQYRLSYVLDIIAVHAYGIFCFFFIIFNFNLRRFVSFILFCIVAGVYWGCLAHRKYTIKECLYHSVFIHYTGNVATLIMLTPSINYLS